VSVRERDDDEAFPTPASSSAAHDEDAFDQAVRRAAAAPAPEQADAESARAEALVAGVYAALSGAEREASLAAVRAKLHARGDDAGIGDAGLVGADVTRVRLGAAVRDALDAFVHGVATREGRAELVVDGGFLAQHGRALLEGLFKGIAGAIGAAPPASSAPAEPPARERPSVPVRIDLGAVLQALVRPAAPAPAPTPDASDERG